MAVDLSKLVSKRKIEFEELRGKTVAVDAFNVLYQFLSIIRQPDGTPLMDSHGNVTSHLSGLFYRTIELIEYGINPIYVFDGIPSVLKQKTIQARMQRRKEQYEAWQKAKEEGNIEEARLRAQGSTRITDQVIGSAKELLDLMGVAHINAPSEGEAQASYMSKKGLVYATASQDYDTLLFGSSYVVRNLTFSGRRKLPRKNVYINVEPELVSFKDTLATLGVTHKQLIWTGIMLGTDFNMGIKGAGPKTALKIAKASKSIDDLKHQIKEKFDVEFELDIKEVEDLFLNPEVKDISKDDIESMLSMSYNKDGIIKFMCRQHDFSEERISKQAERLASRKNEQRQKGIDKWLK
ncbi:MAG: flap endonuclease-1 [Candidatus Micrarchaeota archaeon]|nr:flap endonuclease-1 [Candidatus Micrarchaeota archaeon]